MEGIPNNSIEKHGEISNFHQIYEDRLRIKKIARYEFGLDLDNTKDSTNSPFFAIFNKYYKKEYDELNEKARQFKKEDFKGEGEAKKVLQKQKIEHEKSWAENIAQIDYEKIYSDYPELKEVLDVKNSISALKDFRMKRTFEILNPKVGIKIKDRNEKILGAIQTEIEDNKNKLEQEDQTLVRQAELLEYKKSLSESGHICITPSVAKDLEAIGDRMLTGKPVFLHGPTGTGKTSLARYAANHFTGKDSEMVFCNPQTKESNVWGKTQIKPTGDGGAIFTYLELGPLAKAIKEGKTVVFDEFTALPKEQMVFIKAVFNLKVGDKINVVGDGLIDVAPGFQMIFTANLKSEKNPERQDLPPEVAREFEQNNVKINYINKEESYDVMLSRMLSKDGSLDMSYYDLNTTLPNLALVMSEIQESYTNATDKEVARKAGALDASGKAHSLKKFVMTQGSIEAILSSWSIEKKMKRTEKSFSEFLDERFKTALTFEEYSKEDRILAAKILASRGFLLTLTSKELNLPDDVFAFNTIKAMRGPNAIEELKTESGNVKYLNFKEVAELDPFNKRAQAMGKLAEELLEGGAVLKDQFLTDSSKRFNKIFGKNLSTEAIETTYQNESINIDIEKKLKEFILFYKQSKIDLPPNFEDTIKEIWDRNRDEIQKSIEENGFNDILLMPENLNLPDLNTQMTEGYKNTTFESSNFTSGGGFAGAKSDNVDKPRLVLVHKVQNLEDKIELKKTLNTKGQDVKMDQILTLEDYLVFQRKYFKEEGKHLDEIGATWLATKSGTRLVSAAWYPDDERVAVYAADLDVQHGDLGFRPSRSFY